MKRIDLELIIPTTFPLISTTGAPLIPSAIGIFNNIKPSISIFSTTVLTSNPLTIPYVMKYLSKPYAKPTENTIEPISIRLFFKANGLPLLFVAKKTMSFSESSASIEALEKSPSNVKIQTSSPLPTFFLRT